MKHKFKDIYLSIWVITGFHIYFPVIASIFSFSLAENRLVLHTFVFCFFFSSFALWAERKDWNCANPALLQIPKMKSKQMMAAKKTVRRDSWLPWNYRELQKILCQHGFSNDQGLLWEVLLWKQVNTKFVWKIWSSDDHWHAGQTQFLMTLCSLYEYN